jgi:hypothetical protein
MNIQTPGLTDMLATITRASAGVQTGMPARVVSFTEGPPARCSVKPLLQRRDAETGETTDYPVIPDVPIIYPAGGGFRMSWPLAQNDQVWLVFGSRDISGWKSGGGASAPRSQRRAGLSDAVVLAGFAPSTGDPLMEIVITAAGKLRIGSPGVDLVKTLRDLVLELSTTTVTVPLSASPIPLNSAVALGALATQLTTLVDE